MSVRLEWTTAGSHNHVALYGPGEEADDGQTAEHAGNSVLVIDGLAIEGTRAEIVALLTTAINTVVSAPTPTPLVVVVRDPDASNDYREFGGHVETHDIDAGSMNLRDPDEYEEWASGHYDAAEKYEANGYPGAASFIRETVDAYGPNA